MQQIYCDESPMKELVKRYLNEIVGELQISMEAIDDENHCLLSDFEAVRETFKKVESIAASFYLQCYLSAFSIHFAELSTTVQHLSERRHGGLMVIQRNDPLDRHIHSGIAVEAKLSHSLLESIFYPGNPLHDGAVLIVSDQIVSAANVLPVSSVTVADKKWGTRHRAAIGLTERTDALALVVSEETGQSSFAYKGNLHPVNFLLPMDRHGVKDEKTDVN